MKILSLCLAAALVAALPAHAAKPKLKKAIFAGKLICYNIILDAQDGSGGSVYYTDVKEKILRSGKVVGTAIRNDASGEPVNVTISGGITGQPKIVRKGGKKFATAKGKLVFSDGATGEVEFNSRKIPKANGPRMFDGDFLEITGLLKLIFNSISYSGDTFSYKPTK